MRTVGVLDLCARAGGRVLFVSTLGSGGAPNYAPSLCSVAGLLVAKWGFRGPCRPPSTGIYPAQSSFDRAIEDHLSRRDSADLGTS